MTKTIGATTCGVRVGTVIRLDNGSEKALESAAWLQDVPGYEGIEFAWPVGAGPITEIAVQVEITGRTFRYTADGAQVRVRVGFLDDDEPTTWVGGWAWLWSMEHA